MIYDAFGREYKTEKKPDLRPISSAKVLESSRDYVGAGLTPVSLASIFRDADAGDLSRQAQLFDQIEEKDAHILGEKSKRENIILEQPFKIEPATDAAKDLEIMEFVQEYLLEHEDWSDVLVGFQDAIGKGFAAPEMFWDVSSGQAVISNFEFLDHRRFLFRDDAGYLSKIPKLITDDNPMGIDIPAWRVALHVNTGKTGHPTRKAIYRVAAWMFLFKNYAIKDWAIFSEVYGMPLRLGKYPANATPDEKSALAAAIRNLGVDASGIISESTMIEFIETANKTASAEIYEKLAEFCNRENSKAILGQTLTADVGNSGSRALGDVHNEVRLDLAKSDARRASTTIRSHIIRPLVGFNFGWDAALPKYAPVYEEDEDLVQKSSWVKNIIPVIQVPRKWLYEQFKIPEPEKGEEMVGGPGTSLPVEAKAIVAKDVISGSEKDESPAATLDALGQKAFEAADLSGIIDPVRDLLSTCASLEEFRDRLIDLYPDMNDKDFADIMAQALITADLAGRYDAQ
jgi:phage gp29-like protein